MQTDAVTKKPGLIDPFGREITYLRLSVTDRCDFRCTYCMSDEMTFLPRADVLSLEQLAAVADTFIALGIQKIRITGGEPLIRKNVMWLINAIGQAPGLKELCLTTNGSHLQQYANQVQSAGVHRINISLDSLSPVKFKRITRYGELDQVLRGIKAAQQAGIKKIKLNTVIQKHINLNEVHKLVTFALENELDISFIEEMPLGNISSHSRENEFISSAQLRDIIDQKYPLSASDITSSGPSKYWSTPGYTSLIGFISPHSENFCASCNRVRVTAEGKLLLCLGNEQDLNLKKIMEAYPNDSDYLKKRIVEALQNKPEKHTFDLASEPQIIRFMNATGG